MTNIEEIEEKAKDAAKKVREAKAAEERRLGRDLIKVATAHQRSLTFTQKVEAARDFLALASPKTEAPAEVVEPAQGHDADPAYETERNVM